MRSLPPMGIDNAGVAVVHVPVSGERGFGSPLGRCAAQTVAPAYAARRSELARQIGLGRKPAAAAQEEDQKTS
jgi:hypothetical protein